jgi:hypothetical protein
VPLPLNVRLMTHWPVVAPWLVVARPAVASAISVPGTSTGPSRYLIELSSWQVTSGTVALTFAGSLSAAQL